MGLIPQVKCGRCDRTYSGLRSRCPYCGAHRHKKGKRVSDGDNATWKLIIGILLIVVLIAAVVVILVTSPSDKNDGEGEGKTPPNGSNEGVDNEPGNDPNGGGTENTTQISVTAADGAAAGEITVNVGQAAELTAAVTPATVTDMPVWTSSDEAVVKVEADETGLKATVTGVAAGSATVTVAVGEAKTEIAVTVGDNATVPPAAVVASDIYAKTRVYNPVKDFTCFKIGETVTVTAVVTPSTATSVPVWTSSNPDVMEVTPLDETGLTAKVTRVGTGSATITVTIDNISYSFVARGTNR